MKSVAFHSQVPWQRQIVWTVLLDSIVREQEMSSPQDSVMRDSGVEGNLSRGDHTTRGISPSSMELPSKQSSPRNFRELYLYKNEILKT